MKKRTVIIDGQLLQTKAWSRGMGRYLLALMGGMQELGEVAKFVLVFNDGPGLDDDKRKVIQSIVPSAEMHELPLLRGISPYNEKSNTKILDKFVHANGLEGALFLQTSLFSFDFTPAYPSDTINTCIFYDMIPFKFWDTFVAYFREHEYFSRYKLVYEADKVFAISASVKNDLVHYLGFQPEDVVNISGAAIPGSLNGEHHVSKQSPKDYKYILLPGGDFPHKNMLRAIRGFDIFNSTFGDTYKLLITSSYSQKNQKRMLELSPNIELSGEVSDSELQDFYAHAEVVLFPSLDEGLGLPVLEAVNMEKPVACSDTPIFKELSKDAFHFFDPYNPDEIAMALSSALVGDDAMGKKYQAVRNKFTWKKSAQYLLDADMQKRLVESKSKHAIVVEQDGSVEVTHKLGALVRQLIRSNDIELYMDALRDPHDSNRIDAPLVFNHFLPTKDVTDAFRRKASETDRTLLFTKASRYTRALQREGDNVIYVGTTEKKVQDAFKKAFKTGDA